MKKFITKNIAWILLVIMFVSLIPSITLRITNESKNDNVVISLLYNDLRNKVSSEKLESVLDECLKMGINVVSVMEEDINNMVSRGDITCIKYNVLCHKYDDESIRIANAIYENCPDIAYDSYVVLAKKEKSREMLSYMFPQKYTKKDYMKISDVENMDIYILYDGRKDLWNYSLGYDEEIINMLKERGFNIALVHKVKNYDKTDYLKGIDNIVKKYNVKYMNLKEAAQDNKTEKKENYLGIADIINKNNMTLVVTESVDQLSNQKFTGYNDVFESVMGEGGTKKVLRSYETYDDSQDDGSHYKYRATQFLNSTVDRNMRFITLTQIATKDVNFNDCADFTLKAADEYIKNIKELGFAVNGDTTAFDYNANKKFNCAVCAVIMIMALLVMWQMISGKYNIKITALAIFASLVFYVLTFKIPNVLILLYPTLFSVIMSCFAMTVVLCFVKEYKEKFNEWLLILTSVAVLVITLLIGSVGMSSMLSGINYYVNNDIFRGIKLSLLVPVAYTAIVYYFIFIKNEETSLFDDAKKVLMADIKVYWVLIALFIGGIGLYYIIRSGNVNKISSVEQTLRSAMTEIFPARPRTKEFLIGYPSLVLFVYYVKKHNIPLVNWFFAVGASILAASVTNSFCHVFTDYTTICMRVVNGLLIGILVSAVVYAANYVLVKIASVISKRI